MVSRERAEMFAHSHGMQFIEVCAKTAEGIDEVITMLLYTTTVPCHKQHNYEFILSLEALFLETNE